MQQYHHLTVSPIPPLPQTVPSHAGHRFCIAPMLDLTDRHCRYFLRQFSRQMLLYSEMITTGAILRSKVDYLACDVLEHPLALQLGGSDPKALAQCAKIGEQRGYQEINLNVGCPSDRVNHGHFGACLMAQADLVADCVKAMRNTVSIPVTVKTRTGIDNQDSYGFLCDFIGNVALRGGCNHFIIHARKAWLSGLNPKQNREIPPLDYARVYQLKHDFPALTIILNGGISTLEQAAEHLRYVDGVMVGRAAYQHPAMLADVDRLIFASAGTEVSPIQAIQALFPYIQQQLAAGCALNKMTRHLMGVFQGQPGARQWRRYLSEHSCQHGAGLEVLHQALAQFQRTAVLATRQYQ